MATDIVVPALGESVTEATVAQWLKQPGESVAVDEPVVELETDKVTLEVNASVAGVLSEVVAATGDNVEVGALLGRIGEGEGAAPKPAAAPRQEAKDKAQPAPQEEIPKAETKPASKEAAAASLEAPAAGLLPAAPRLYAPRRKERSP